MTATRARPSARRRTAPPSAYKLIMDYEQSLIEAVEATIAAGLAEARATPVIGERVAAAWREPLMVVAADELSRDLQARAGKQERPRSRLAMLRRRLAPYATLVAAAAASVSEQPSSPGFIAAD